MESSNSSIIEKPRKPEWLRVKLPTGKEYLQVREIVSKHKLHTICESGNCPNMGECWGAGTATFMILGNICTRSCGFCSVATGRPRPVDWDEPMRVANSVKLMNVKHCVITSVDRDDLKDGGSIIWAETIKAIREQSPETKFETLIPDFAGKWENLQRIIDVKPDIISHNIETVKRLTPQVRIQAKYDRSMEVIKRIHDAGLKTKSGIMVGLGEEEGSVSFFENDSGGNTGGNSFNIQSGDGNTTLEITTLDTWAKKNDIKKIDFIKSDIEGYERHMLSGATTILREHQPILSICTYHLPDDREVIKNIILKANPNYTIIQRKMKLFAFVKNSQPR